MPAARPPSVARPRFATWAPVVALAVTGGCGVPPDPVHEQPRLAAYASQYRAPLRAAGIQKIVSWSDRAEQPVQVTTQGGPIYFPYRPGIALARFTLDATGPTIRVLADDYDGAGHERYTQTMSWVIGEALRFAGDNNARIGQRDRASR